MRQNLRVFGRLYHVEGLDERIASLAADLDDGVYRPAGRAAVVRTETRVALAKALINAPDVLLLDADRLARPRHRRLGAGPDRDIP